VERLTQDATQRAGSRAVLDRLVGQKAVEFPAASQEELLDRVLAQFDADRS
jgi:hypothetical protein